MMWHTDNRLYEKNKADETHTTSPGNLLAYLSMLTMVNFNIQRLIFICEKYHHDYTKDFIEQKYKN